MERLLIVAVANRPPAWLETGCQDYLARMPREFSVKRTRVKPESRTHGLAAGKMLEHEARRILAALPQGAKLVALDERGRDLSTAQFAQHLRRWLDEGTPTAFLIGGPDGLHREVTSRAAMTLRLSSLTLPHALAQLLLCEQLYRAASLLMGHPYHRDG